MEHCHSPDGVTSISVRPYYTMLSRVYLALAMGFLDLLVSFTWKALSSNNCTRGCSSLQDRDL